MTRSVKACTTGALGVKCVRTGLAWPRDAGATDGFSRVGPSDLRGYARSCLNAVLPHCGHREFCATLARCSSSAVTFACRLPRANETRAVFDPVRFNFAPAMVNAFGARSLASAFGMYHVVVQRVQVRRYSVPMRRP